METIKEKINRIKEIENQFNQDFPKPIEESKIEEFKEIFLDFFKIEVDEEFLDFLKICDGLDFNGFQIYSSYNHTIKKVLYGIFENNELWYEVPDFKKYVFFAESGQDLFVFNKESKKYELLDRYCGDLIKTYNSFNNMLLYILKLMLYEEV